MTTKKIMVTKRSILAHTFMTEEEVIAMLVDRGFDMATTTWTYSWTPPAWASMNEKANIEKQLEDRDYYSYLINVRQETIQ